MKKNTINNDELIGSLDRELNNVNNLKDLSNAFNHINNALNKACNQLYKTLFDYKFSMYLYYEYIMNNKTKVEIADDLGISPSTVYYYIKKYEIKKDRKLTNKKIVDTLKKTCNEKYNVNHPGELPEAHRKRIINILNKTNGNYSKSFYEKLNRSNETLNKMRQSQQIRRYIEKEGDT